MINVRETEIRSESLEIVMEAYKVANNLPDSSINFKSKLVDKAFMVSSRIANAFIALEDDHFETEIMLALEGIVSINNDLSQLQIGPPFAKIDLQPFQLLLKNEKIELQELLAASKTNNVDTLTPKLEKVCI